MVYPFVHAPRCSSIHPFIYLSTHLRILLSAHSSFGLSVLLFVCPSIRLRYFLQCRPQALIHWLVAPHWLPTCAIKFITTFFLFEHTTNIKRTNSTCNDAQYPFYNGVQRALILLASLLSWKTSAGYGQIHNGNTTHLPALCAEEFAAEKIKVNKLGPHHETQDFRDLIVCICVKFDIMFIYYQVLINLPWMRLVFYLVVP